MPRSAVTSRDFDLQSLKQAHTALGRAIQLFALNDPTVEAEAVGQAQLAWRFLDEFVDKRS